MTSTDPEPADNRRHATITINGTPAPQGSKKGIPTKNGKVAMIESAGQKLTNWRQDVRTAAQEQITTPLQGPVHVNVVFYLPRPKGHYRTGRNAGILKDAAPTYHTTKPDIDKLERATLDALTSAGTYTDDATVVAVTKWKLYADARPPGATITLQELEGTQARSTPGWLADLRAEDKRLTNAELAAEWHAATDSQEPPEENRKARTLHRFATTPHHDQEQEQ